MNKVDYQITFNTPAFLGDAEQKSAWRTPPFKALIQHWWRIAVAKEHDYDCNKIRESEGRLFGHAWLKDITGKDWAMRSRVRIRLAECKAGSLKTWPKDNHNVKYPEVKFPVGSQLYLGYGPLDYKKGLKNPLAIKNPPAIKIEENNQLTLIYPKINEVTFTRVMWLIQWFGTLGGRSRNGWGSVNIKGHGIGENTVLKNDNPVFHAIKRPIYECLKLDWPHAIGTDEQGLLIWQTQERGNWQLVVKDLAQIKIKFRTDLPFSKIIPDGFESRHLLAYPVTKHNMDVWGETGRLANQLRFKILRMDNNKFIGIIVHLPCAIPNEMWKKLHNAPNVQQQIEIWQKVHNSLNSQHDLKRIAK